MAPPAPPSLVLSDGPPPRNQLADHAAFVLLAEFDIDQGSTLAHQYPFPTGTDEHALADLMLPDGAHLRAEDWTIFYLNQVPSNTVVDLLALDSNSDAGTDDDGQQQRLKRSFSLSKSYSGGKGKGKEKQELLYVLNCVRMKEDKTLRRGARVKALAVCTPHPFIQIYKPLLVLALEEYFQSPSASVLARLFDALNAIDTSAMPRLSRSEKLILRASERRDLFEEKFWAVGKIAAPPGKAGGGGEGGASARARAASVAFGKKIGLEEEEEDGEEELELEMESGAPVGVEDGGVFEDSEEGVGFVGSTATRTTPHLGRKMSSSSSSASSPPPIPQVPPPPLPIPSSSATAPPPPSHNPSSSPPRTRLKSSSSHLSLASSFRTSSNNDHHSSRSPTPSKDSHGSHTNAAQQSQPIFVPMTAQGSSTSILIPPTTPHQQHTPYQPQTPGGGAGGGFGMGPPPPGKGKKVSKDTHYFETGAWFRGISVPIRIPLGTFEEEVGDYSLIHLIQTFSPLSPPPPPFAPPFLSSLHTAGPSTNPIILLFNALVTQRRVIFLGHGKAAGQVANFVLAACALGSGGGGVLKGFTSRAFPYANLAGLDMLEEVPGYIAGVTNPRFEDLPSRWDVLCNIETGRIILSKEIKGDPPLPSSSSSSSANSITTSSNASTAVSSPANTINSFAPFSPTTTPYAPSSSTFSSHGTMTPGGASSIYGGASGSQTPATSVFSGGGTSSSRFSPSIAGGGDGGETSSVMTGGTVHGGIGGEDEEKLISRSTVVSSRQGRSDSGSKGGSSGESDGLFMEEIHSLISSHFGEAIIRTRFTDYLQRFIRLTSRYEEETYGLPSPSGLRTWYPTLPCDAKRGRLGSGVVLWDGELWLGGEGNTEGRRKESEGGFVGTGERRTVKEFVGGNGVRRIEGWRASKSYELWREDFNNNPVYRSELSFDLVHQLSRLRYVTRVIPRSEIKMMFKYLATEVRSYESVVELLSHTPASWGGLLPFGFALFHDSNAVKGYILEFFDSLQQYPIGRSFLLSLNAFHRLAYRRLSEQRLVGIASERDPQVRRALTEARRNGEFQHPEVEEDTSSSPVVLNGLGVEGLNLGPM